MGCRIGHQCPADFAARSPTGIPHRKSSSRFPCLPLLPSSEYAQPTHVSTAQTRLDTPRSFHRNHSKTLHTVSPIGRVEWSVLLGWNGTSISEYISFRS